jgi:uncharacterized protein YjbJ (UPF0337 family)
MAFSSNVDHAWEDLKKKIKNSFGRLSETDIESLKGNINQLSGKLQKTYGYAKEEADKKFTEFAKSAQSYIDKVGRQAAKTVDQASKTFDKQLDGVSKSVETVKKNLKESQKR